MVEEENTTKATSKKKKTTTTTKEEEEEKKQKKEKKKKKLTTDSCRTDEGKIATACVTGFLRHIQLGKPYSGDRVNTDPRYMNIT